MNNAIVNHGLKILAIIGALIFTEACQKNDQGVNPTPSGSLTGLVRSAKTGLPIGGVNISTQPATSTAISDSLGLYSFPQLSPGTYQVIIATAYWDTVRQTVSIVSSIAATVNASLKATIPTGQLSLYLPFSGNTSDSSGEGQITSRHNVALVADRFGIPASASGFTGDSCYLSFPNGGISGHTKLTIGLWFKTTSGGLILGSQSSELYTWPPAAYVPNIEVGTDGKLYAYLWNGTLPPMKTTFAVNDGVWHFAALVGDETFQTLYVDGELISQISGTISDSHSPFNQFGTGNTGVRNGAGWPGGNDEWFQYVGKLDDVRIYDRALSAQECAQLFHER